MRFIILFLFPIHLFSQTFSKQEIARWEQQAQRVTIIRDNWGIPHIYGKSDADAVFGLLYAQCEDDFKRVEMNYIEKLGRMSEVKGESELYEDLLIRLVIDSTEAIADYKKAPKWLKKLLNAQADAINYYIHRHPENPPVLLHRFEPWYNLLWTDGSIGAINTADLTTTDLRNLYSGETPSTGAIEPEAQEEILTGSNGFAFAPSITESGNAILYINPHVTFYFRPEVHVVSKEGLNTYGAVTWGQMFVYQGFNDFCGWMHTSSYTDIADTYIEKMTQKDGKWFYEYNGVQRPVTEKAITLRYKKDGKTASKTINALFTHHGPIMARRNGQWLSMKANNRSMAGLIQSWNRTKASNFNEFKAAMDLLANTSNNTVYADADGNIAYWHGNYQPVRDTQYDWSKPVDGSIPETEWKGLHPVEESIHIYNPENGWIQNCNSTPFTAAGSYSPKAEKYPKYMAPDGENFRGINAVKVLSKRKRYNIDKVIQAGYDTNLAAFEVLIPALLRAYDTYYAPGDSLHLLLQEPINVLKQWDFHSGEQSVATTLAVEWGQRLLTGIQRTLVIADEEDDMVQKTKQFATTAPPATLLNAMAGVVGELQQKFGTWQVPWGDLNRFQRISSDIAQQYKDDQPSIPVGFASSTWGQLPSYTSRYYPGTQKRYGVNGNSFVCAVEFGDRIKAKSLLAGGQSGDPKSPHFKDQMEGYAKGQFKDVLFYKEDVEKKAEATYHPGERQ